LVLGSAETQLRLRRGSCCAYCGRMDSTFVEIFTSGGNLRPRSLGVPIQDVYQPSPPPSPWIKSSHHNGGKFGRLKLSIQFALIGFRDCVYACERIQPLTFESYWDTVTY
jgi:hypothetical protein